MGGIWTKNLEATRVGCWVFFRILPALMVLVGIHRIISKNAKIKSVEYHGGDAVLLGGALILLALACFNLHNMLGRAKAVYTSMACFFVGIALHVYVCLLK